MTCRKSKVSDVQIVESRLKNNSIITISRDLHSSTQRVQIALRNAGLDDKTTKLDKTLKSIQAQVKFLLSRDSGDPDLRIIDTYIEHCAYTLASRKEFLLKKVYDDDNSIRGGKSPEQDLLLSGGSIENGDAPGDAAGGTDGTTV